MRKQYSVPSGSKEVLRDGLHFADACSNDEANQIATAMNDGLARIAVELTECRTCKGVGAHEPACVDRPINFDDLVCPSCRWRGGHSPSCIALVKP